MTSTDARPEPLFLQIGAPEVGDFIRIEIVGRRHIRASARAARAWLSGRVSARAAGGGFRSDFAAYFQDLDFADFAEELRTLLDGAGKKRKIGAMVAAGVASFYTLEAQAQITVVRREPDDFVAECVLQDDGANVQLEFSLPMSPDDVRGLLSQTTMLAAAYPSAWREDVNNAKEKPQNNQESA